MQASVEFTYYRPDALPEPADGSESLREASHRLFLPADSEGDDAD